MKIYFMVLCFISCLWIFLLTSTQCMAADEYDWPVNDHTISSGFGPRIRETELGLCWEFHSAFDFPVAIGTEIYAAHDGVVEIRLDIDFLGDGGYGNVLILWDVENWDDIGGFTESTRYCHLSNTFPEEISTGDFVQMGQLIAYSGDTGAGGAHLHFEYLNRNIYANWPVDPPTRPIGCSKYKQNPLNILPLENNTPVASAIWNNNNTITITTTNTRPELDLDNIYMWVDSKSYTDLGWKHISLSEYHNNGVETLNNDQNAPANHPPTFVTDYNLIAIDNDDGFPDEHYIKCSNPTYPPDYTNDWTFGVDRDGQVLGLPTGTEEACILIQDTGRWSDFYMENADKKYKAIYLKNEGDIVLDALIVNPDMQWNEQLSHDNQTTFYNIDNALLIANDFVQNNNELIALVVFPNTSNPSFDEYDWSSIDNRIIPVSLWETCDNVPTSLFVIKGTYENYLSWNAPHNIEGLSSYNIYRGTNHNGPYTFLDNTSNTIYADNNIDDGETYYYVVTVVYNDGTESGYSNEAEPSSSNPFPAPTSLTVIAGSGAYIDLSWDISNEDLSNYNVYRGTSTGIYDPIPIASPNTSNYRDDNVILGVTYYYVVTAIYTNPDRESFYSNEVSVTPYLSTPVNLTTDLNNTTGEVELNWNYGTGSGFYEDFNDGVADNWIPVNGNWFVSGEGTYQVSNTDNNHCSSYYNNDFANYQYEVKWKYSDYDIMGIYFNGNPNNLTQYGSWKNGYKLFLSSVSDNTNWCLFKCVDGNSSLIQEVTSININISSDAWNTLKAVYSNGYIDIYFNDVLEGSYYDDTFTLGKIGLITYNDNTSTSQPEYDYVSLTPLAKGYAFGTVQQNKYRDIYSSNNENYNGELFSGEIIGRELAPTPIKGTQYTYTSEKDNKAFLHFNIYRDETFIATTTFNTYLDDLSYYGNYNYKVTTCYDEGESLPVGPVNINWVPSPSTNLVATFSVSDNANNLSWNAPNVGNISGYKIYRRETEISNLYTELVTTTNNNYSDNAIIYGIEYCYVVTTLYSNPDGESEYSNHVKITPRFTTMYESFESSFPPNGWILTGGENNNWERSSGEHNINPYNGSYCTYHDDKVTAASDKYCIITPAIELAPNTAHILEFYEEDYYYDTDHYYHGVWISTFGANMGYAVELYEQTTETNGWRKVELDLSNYAGNTVWIGFKYMGYGDLASDEWYVDDITVYSPNCFPPPTNLIVTPSSNAIDLSWNVPLFSEGLSHYEILRKNNDSSNWFCIADNIHYTNTNYSDNNIATDTDYYYKVKAVYTNPIGANYSNIDAARCLMAPTNLVATGGNGVIDLIWNAPNKALIGYKVYRDLGNGYSYIATTTNTNYTDNVNSGITYYYIVEAIYENPDGESASSEEASATSFGSPINLVATGENDHICLTWDAPNKSLSNYEVYRSTIQGSGYTKIDNINTTNYEDYGAASGVTYYYVVKAIYEDPDGVSILSEEVSATYFAAPTNLITNSENGYINLTWDAPSKGLSDYGVYRSTTQGSGYTKIDNINTTNYKDYEVASSITYYYTIITYYTNPDGQSVYSDEASVTYFAAPTNLIATNEDNYINLVWDTPNNIKKKDKDFYSYCIYRSTIPETDWDWDYLHEVVDGENYKDYKVDNETTYYYTITAYYTNPDGQSVYSNEDSITYFVPPTIPKNLIATWENEQTQVSLNWTASDIVTEYYIYRTEEGSDTTILLDSVDKDITSYIDASVEYCNTYSYYVTAVNSIEVESNPSNIITISQPEPNIINNLVATPNIGKVDLTWNSNEECDIISYHIAHCQLFGTRTTNWVVIDTIAVSDTTYSDNNLDFDAMYYYRIRAEDSCGKVSAWSIPIGPYDITPPNTPENLEAFSKAYEGDGNDILLQWNSAVDDSIITYLIYRSMQSSKHIRDYVVIDTTIQNTYIDVDISVKGTYLYYIVAIDTMGYRSQASIIDMATTITTSGIIDNYEEWPGLGNKNDLLITDDISILDTLRIQAGTTIKVETDKKIKLSDGTLIAIGNFINKITFTITPKAPRDGLWGGIFNIGTFSSNNGKEGGNNNIIIEYCDINSADCGIYIINNTNFTIKNNDITNCNTGICIIDDNQGQILGPNNNISDNIEYNIIAENSNTRIYNNQINNAIGLPDVYIGTTSIGPGTGFVGRGDLGVVLEYNEIIGNYTDGISCEDYHSPIIQTDYQGGGCNTIINNGRYGIFSKNKALPSIGIDEKYNGFNNIYSNGVYNIRNEIEKSIQTQFNYWENDDPNKTCYGEINASEILIEPPTCDIAKSLNGIISTTLSYKDTSSLDIILYEEALEKFLDGDISNAISILHSLISDYPDSDIVPYSFGLLVSCYTAAHSEQNLIDYLDSFDNPHSKVSPFLQAYTKYLTMPILARMGQHENALNRCNKLINNPHLHNQQKYILYYKGKYNYLAGNYILASNFLKIVVKKHPNTPIAYLSSYMLNDMGKNGKWLNYGNLSPAELPSEYSLSQNYPNPFNPETHIKFGLPEAGFVKLKIYNVIGQLVKTLTNE